MDINQGLILMKALIKKMIFFCLLAKEGVSNIKSKAILKIIDRFYMQRCSWVGVNKPYYEEYHDNEWGIAVHDDTKHFEMLTLEGAQAGLSWETILKRREGYKKSFKNFVVEQVANMSDSELEELMKNPQIIRNRLKIFSVRKNAIIFRQIQKEFTSFDKYIWQFVDGKTIINYPKTLKDINSKSKESDAISKDLKKRGMTFVGSTIIYAYMQAIGMVDDHLENCFKRKIRDK